jgi:hypothetical protein
MRYVSQHDGCVVLLFCYMYVVAPVMITVVPLLLPYRCCYRTVVDSVCRRAHVNDRIA